MFEAPPIGDASAAAPDKRCPLAARARRVSLLSVAIVLMAYSDLSHTLTYARAVGMIELNPLARFVMQEGGVAGLTIYKALSVTICVGILLSLRHKRQAEVCAWACSGAMLVLMLHWMNYNAHIHNLMPYLHEVALANSPEWVHLPN